ncbi:MAG TPA: hypothetical protein PKJ41_17150 [Bryobacteraceae bacterium]|nr:hypothetical protein [Bryobacteraceae bacterium]HPT25422.1 hypothetical protein [Bryobacteraceae bacterium]
MAEPLYLSFWLKGYAALGLPVYFRKAVEVFPASKLAPGGVLRIHALSFREPPLFEEWFDETPEPNKLAKIAEQFLHQDAAFCWETRWDLWQWDEEWSLKPSAVALECYGPQFESSLGEHFRIDAGSDRLYLPCEKSDQLRPVQSNVRSILHLASDIGDAIASERRLLWSESEGDFAVRLQDMLG